MAGRGPAGDVETSRPTVVVGQGALGTLFGAVLADRGADVHVVSSRADEAHEVTLESRGRVRATGEVTLRPDYPEHPAWLVLVCTRADGAVAAGREATEHLAADGLLAAVQNGLVPLEVVDEVGPEVAAPLVVGFNAVQRGPKLARATSKPQATTGPDDEAAAPKVGAMVDGLDEHLRVRETSNPRGAVWSKWCVSCAINGLAVVADTGLAGITQHRTGRAAVVGVVTECARIADAAGVDLERVAGPITPSTLAGRAESGLGGALRRGVVWMLGRAYAGVTPSALSAAREGRDPELGELNRRAIEAGAEHGIETPYNRALLELAEEILAGERTPGTDQLRELVGRAGDRAAEAKPEA